MRKLKLELESLLVESFSLDSAGDGAGTVHARSDTETCEMVSKDPTDCGVTCGISCNESCYYACMTKP
ncbi:MAG TPA: hypothetical protein VF771_15780 [Longimicrobiaceae bacterium]